MRTDTKSTAATLAAAILVYYGERKVLEIASDFASPAWGVQYLDHTELAHMLRVSGLPAETYQINPANAHLLARWTVDDHLFAVGLLLEKTTNMRYWALPRLCTQCGDTEWVVMYQYGDASPVPGPREFEFTGCAVIVQQAVLEGSYLELRPF